MPDEDKTFSDFDDVTWTHSIMDPFQVLNRDDLIA